MLIVFNEDGDWCTFKIRFLAVNNYLQALFVLLESFHIFKAYSKYRYLLIVTFLD
jgi:hypothetical protein